MLLYVLLNLIYFFSVNSYGMCDPFELSGWGDCAQEDITIQSLHAAVRYGDKEKIEFYLQTTDVNALDAINATPLHKAHTIKSSQHRYDILKFLLEKNADPNIKFLGNTALYYSAKSNNRREIKLFLKHKARPVDKDLKDALYCYEHYISSEVVELFLRQGVNVNCENNINWGAKPSLHCLMVQHTGFNKQYDENLIKLKMLLAYGADIGLQDRRGNTLFHYMVEQELFALAEDCLEKPKIFLKTLLILQKIKGTILQKYVPKLLVLHIAKLVNPCCKIILDKRLDDILLLKNTTYQETAYDSACENYQVTEDDRYKRLAFLFKPKNN